MYIQDALLWILIYGFICLFFMLYITQMMWTKGSENNPINLFNKVIWLSILVLFVFFHLFYFYLAKKKEGEQSLNQFLSLYSSLEINLSSDG